MTRAGESRNRAFHGISFQRDVTASTHNGGPPADECAKGATIGHELRDDLDSVARAKPLDDRESTAACYENCVQLRGNHAGSALHAGRIDAVVGGVAASADLQQPDVRNSVSGCLLDGGRIGPGREKYECTRNVCVHGRQRPFAARRAHDSLQFEAIEDRGPRHRDAELCMHIVKGVERRLGDGHGFHDLAVDDDVALGGPSAAAQVEEVRVQHADDVDALLAQTPRNVRRTLTPEQPVARANVMYLELTPTEIY